jgi:hypothetical protein
MVMGRPPSLGSPFRCRARQFGDCRVRGDNAGMEQHRTFLITPNGVINLDQVSCIQTGSEVMTRKSGNRRAPRKNTAHTVELVGEDSPTGQAEMYLELDGLRIAKRGHPDSPQARTWIALEPGYQVLDGRRDEAGNGSIVINYNGRPVLQ